MEQTDATRDRLFDGMAAALLEKGYAATTIADIVRHARVSKRTFYEHFADKEACFLASFEHASDCLLAIVVEAATPDLPWREQVSGAVGGYLGALQSAPGMTRALLLELPAAGSRALALRRRYLGRFAEMLGELTIRANKEHTEVRPLSPATCTALVGGINELVLLAVEDGHADRLTDLAPTAADLIAAALQQGGSA
jgi:AcrR family transcriptional regulator